MQSTVFSSKVKVGVCERVRSDLRLEGGEGLAVGCVSRQNAGREGAVHIRGNAWKLGGGGGRGT